MRVQAQREIDELRHLILSIADVAEPEAWLSSTDLERMIEDLPQRIAEQVSLSFRGLRRVLNATGIVVHTNLGRSPLPVEVVEEVAPLLTAYCDLEVDLASGKRGERNRGVEPLLGNLCGAEAAIVTNNNAAAMVLILSALAKDREVIVSRGELVEIGGSFRIPDILAAAGARLREVGTTNRTRLSDYENAICDETALLLKVHPSNYRIRGFTEETAGCPACRAWAALWSSGGGRRGQRPRDPCRAQPAPGTYQSAGASGNRVRSGVWQR